MVRGSARDLSLQAEFKVSAFSWLSFWLSLYSWQSWLCWAPSTVFFVLERWFFCWISKVCCCHNDCTALGQSCKQKQTDESQRTHSKLVTPPHSLPVLIQSPKTLIDFCLLSRVYSLQEDPLVKCLLLNAINAALAPWTRKLQWPPWLIKFYFLSPRVLFPCKTVSIWKPSDCNNI